MVEIVNLREDKYDGMMDMVAELSASFIHDYIVWCYCTENIWNKNSLPKS